VATRLADAPGERMRRIGVLMPQAEPTIIIVLMLCVMLVSDLATKSGLNRQAALAEGIPSRAPARPTARRYAPRGTEKF
jgi:hypothetical protein